MAVQSGYEVILTWTNPSLYVDGNTVNDLSVVHILSDGAEIATVPAGPPGKPQSFTINARDLLNQDRTFSIRIDGRPDRSSGLSNAAAIQAVDVPGVVTGIAAKPDQSRIWLSWDPPAVNTALAESYIVSRSDGPVFTTTEPRYEDGDVDPGKTYTYTVTAVRGTAGGIPGPVSSPVSVTMVDRTPPPIPEGFTVDRSSLAAGIGILSWNESMAQDLLGYKVYRSDRPDGGWELRTPMPIAATAFSDPDYVSGSWYQISAVDLTGNESDRTEPQRGP